MKNNGKTRRKRAKKKLSGVEEKYYELIETANDAIFIADGKTGVIIYVNKRAGQLIGIPSEKIIGMHQSQLHPKGEAERYKKIFHDHVRSGKAISEELFVCYSDGRKIPVEISASVIELNGKKIIQGIFHDLTYRKKTEEALQKAKEELERKVAERTSELLNANKQLQQEIVKRKRYEEKLQESEELYRNLFENSVVGIGMSQRNRIVSANKALLTIFGYDTLKEFVKIPLLDHVAPESKELVKERLKKREIGEPVVPQYEYKIVRKDGEIRDIEIFTSDVIIGDKKYVQSVFRDITKRKLAEKEIRWNYDTQSVINALLYLSLESIPLEEFLKNALDLILLIPGVILQQRGGIFLIEDDPVVLVMKAQNKLAEPIQKACARVPFGRCLCGRAALTQEIQYAASLDERHETTYEGIKAHGHYCVPIIFSNQTIGVLNLYVNEGHSRSQKEEGFLITIANTLSGIIVRKKTYEDLQQLTINTITSLASAIDAKSRWTTGHSERVTSFAVEIAKEIGLKDKDLEYIKLCGLLHDIGKIGIYDEVLDKIDKLTDEELEHIKTHTSKGAEILMPIKQLQNVIPGVLHHHERYDGKGYPEGLKGEDIPLCARILSVADAFDSMTADRPYRQSPGQEYAILEIKRCAGTQFDPKIAEAFLRILSKE
ncbi:MAG: PAS domain S-box protein [Nitrospirae bacterium]|nr:PAS domain S-box protein [Nitrospirota bacterium]